MLYEFALLPEVIEEAVTSPDISKQRELIGLLRQVRENAMLVDTDSDAWSKQVRQVIELVSNEGPSYRAEIKMLFGQLLKHNRIVRHHLAGSQVADDWLRQADDIRSICRFDGIFTSASLWSHLTELPDHYYPFPPPPEHVQRMDWYGKRSRSTRKCRSEFMSVLDPVLRHAQRVDLVDPYINCENSHYKETLELCVELLSKAHTGHPSLVIHAKASNNNHGLNADEEWKASWTNYFQSISVSRSLTLRAFRWKETSRERFHNRYVFTDQGVGLSIPYGLDCHEANKASQDSWQLMDIEAAQKEWTKFTSAPVYERVAKVEVRRLT